MSDHDIHALSGAYAVDALDDLERARFEAHLEHCAVCRDEVASLQESAAALGDLSAATPPPALRDRLLTDIASIRPLPPRSARPGTSRSWWRPLVAAAAVLGAVGLGAVVVEQLQSPDTVQTVSAADRVIAAADARTVSAKLPHGASARVVHSAKLGKAVLLTSGLPAAPTGKVYELWLQDSAGTMVPAGLMQGGDQKVVFKGDATTAEAAGITVEPAGGSDQPTTAPIALFDFSEGI